MRQSVLSGDHRDGALRAEAQIRAGTAERRGAWQTARRPLLARQREHGHGSARIGTILEHQ